MNPLRTGARILADQLRIQGVNHVFCRFAPELEGLLDALGETGGIRVIATRHNSAAADMAIAYARLTGQPGVALVAAGTPMLQATAALHHARQRGLPLALIAAQKPLDPFPVPSAGTDGAATDGSPGDRVRNWAGQMSPWAKWVAGADDADRLPDLVSLGFQTASSGHPGPVVLAVTDAALTQASAIGNGRCRPAILPAPSDMQIASLRRALGQAQRPVVVVGGTGGNRSTLDNLRAFVDANRLPVACVPGGQDEFDNRHPHYIGDTAMPGCRTRIGSADLVLALGVAWRRSGIAGGPDTAGDDAGRQVLVHAHPAIEFLYAGGADLAIHTGMPQLAARLAMMTPIENPPWLASPTEGHAALQAWRSRPAIPEVADASPLAPWRVLLDLRDALPDDAIVCGGSGIAAVWLERFFPYRAPATQLAPLDVDPGSAVAAAVAAKIIAPDKTVVCVCRGDDLVAGAPALATAMEQAAGVLFVVFHDRPHADGEPAPSGTRLHGPDPVALIGAHGGWGTRIADANDFPAALADAQIHARTHRSPALVEINASFRTR